MEQKQTYKIDGMMCGGCSGAVQAALMQTDGVSDARVSHVDGTAVVTHALTDDEIARIVEKAGYHVSGKGR
jgi:copper chaperone CopZ